MSFHRIYEGSLIHAVADGEGTLLGVVKVSPGGFVRAIKALEIALIVI